MGTTQLLPAKYDNISRILCQVNSLNASRACRRMNILSVYIRPHPTRLTYTSVFIPRVYARRRTRLIPYPVWRESDTVLHN